MRCIQILGVLFLSAVLCGCASGMKREVHNLEYQVSEKNRQIDKAQALLSADPKVYAEGVCRKPERGSRPNPSCDDIESSQERALVNCAVAYKGCDVALKLFEDKLDTNIKRFLASETCDRMAAEIAGSGYSSANTVRNATSTYASDRCKNGGFFGKLFGCITAGTIEVMKFAEFQQCYNTKARQCYDTYLAWKNGPDERNAGCERNVALIAENKSEISGLEDRIYEKKRTWTWRLFGDD